MSLWTVPFELECYIGLVGLTIIGATRRPRFLLMSFVLLVAAVFAWQAHLGFVWSRPEGKSLVVAFVAGVVLYTWRYTIPHSWPLFTISAVGSIALLATPHTAAFAALPVAYVTVYLGLLNAPRIPVLSSGDYSYGIYLYAFPMQQLQVWLMPDHRTWWVNILFALPLSVGWAMLSWHLVEWPVLSRRKIAMDTVSSLEKRLIWVARAGVVSKKPNSQTAPQKAGISSEADAETLK